MKRTSLSTSQRISSETTQALSHQPPAAARRGPPRRRRSGQPQPAAGVARLLVSHPPQRAVVRIPLVTWMPSTGDFITVIGNRGSAALGSLFEAAVDTDVAELPYDSAKRIGGLFDDGYHSDHAPYWKAGIPAILLTDTGNSRWETYHQPGDLAADIDIDILSRVTRATAATALELASR